MSVKNLGCTAGNSFLKPHFTRAMTPSDCVQLDHLQTEERSAQARLMNSLDTLDLRMAFNHEESRVSSVACYVADIALFVNDLVPTLHAGGRLIYVGAGNSGRIAFMDCHKLSVKFTKEESQVVTVVASGQGMATQAQEGAEDAEQGGAAQFEALNLTSNDAMLGHPASGRMSCVMGALKVTYQIRTLTASITNMSPSLVGEICNDYPLGALLGPEFRPGSPRLKAGSATKHILNMKSTCAMIKLEKTYRGLIIDLRDGNHKLQARARRIIHQICREILRHYLKRDLILPSPILKKICQVQNDDAANDNIRRVNGSVELPCEVAVTNLLPNEAILQLQRKSGDFGAFVANHLDLSYVNEDENIASIGPDDHPEYFLAIDGGGTKCAVSIATRLGVVSRGYAGPCNFNTVTAEEVVSQVKKATMEAIDLLPQNGDSRLSTSPRFRKVWAGIAGLHHANKLDLLTRHLEKLLGVSAEMGSLRLTSDSALLGACIEKDVSIRSGISLISGTGSVATAFQKDLNGHAVEVRRTGGWGHLIGDDGSAFHIGKQALQALLRNIELNEADAEPCLTEMEEEALAYFGCTKNAVLSRLLYSGKNPTSDIGGLAKVVTRLAFRDRNPNIQALGILRAAATSLAQLILPLTNTCPPNSCMLILSGALMAIAKFRELIYEQFVLAHITNFKEIVVIDSVSDCAVNRLAAQVI